MSVRRASWARSRFPEIGRPFYQATAAIDALALIETPPDRNGAEGGSHSLRRWTRTQRIRTAAAIPVEALIVDPVEVPVYLRIAETATHLRDLGMSDKAIARALDVSDKTVTKSLTFRKPLRTV